MNNPVRHLALVPLLLPISLLAGEHDAEAKASPNALEAGNRTEREDAPRCSPFEMVRWNGQEPEVKVKGRWWRLVSIDGVERDALLDHARSAFGGRWAKRFCEDLLEVLDGLGHRPRKAVDLVLEDLETGERRALAAVPMTGENRRRIREAQPRPEATDRSPVQTTYEPANYPALSPFEMIRWNGLEPEVQFRGTWWRLVSIEGVPREELLDHARSAFGRLWAKRFCEDLPEVLAGLGHAPAESVALELQDLASGEHLRVADAPMSAAFRRRIHAAEPRPKGDPLGASRSSDRRGRSGSDAGIQRVKRPRPASVAAAFDGLVRTIPGVGGGGRNLTRTHAVEDLGQLEWLIARRFSYRDRVGFDWRGAFDALHAGLGKETGEGELAYRIHKLLTRFGDGHSRLRRSTSDLLLPGSLPLRLVRSGADVAAIGPDGELPDPEHPYLIAIDGEPLDAWLDAVRAFVPIGSEAMTERQTLRRVVHFAHLRAERGLPAAPAAELTFGNRHGERTTRTFELADRAPRAPRLEDLEVRTFEGNVGYLRIGSMGGDGAFLEALDRALDRLEGSRGLILDLRGNGGGSRRPLLHVAPRLMPPELPAVVVNVAALRVDSEAEARAASAALEDRFLHPADWSGWSDAARAAVRACAAEFEPSWQPASDEFSEWHYLVLERDPQRPRLTDGPIVVLLDGGCFSATDIFLGAMAQLPGVTLMGRPSGGGSGRARRHVLAHSGISLQLSTMISFLPDGQAYDGEGIRPDVDVPATLDDHLGRSDSVLDCALAWVRR